MPLHHYSLYNGYYLSYIYTMKQILCFSIFLCVQTTFAQQAKTHRLPVALLQFFQGSWSGEGQFSSGRPIQASLSFKLALDSSWLTCEHTDKAPASYKAMLFWGIDPFTGQFIAYAFDNNQGHRQFQSEGWKENHLILENVQEYPGRGIFYQHFIYEQLDSNQFKMTYETSKDGKTWKMVDFLVFKRNG